MGHLIIYKVSDDFKKIEELKQIHFLCKGLISDINFKLDEQIAIVSSEDGTVRLIEYLNQRNKEINYILGAALAGLPPTYFVFSPPPPAVPWTPPSPTCRTAGCSAGPRCCEMGVGGGTPSWQRVDNYLATSCQLDIH